MRTLKPSLFLVALLALVAVPALAHNGTVEVPQATATEALELEQGSACAADPLSELTALEQLLVPDAQLACGCRDQCRTSSDCTLWCGEPAACVMVNSCCRECACTSTF